MYPTKIAVGTLVVLSDEVSCNIQTHKVVWVVEMFTARCGTPDPDFIGRCCREKYNASILWSVYLQE